MSQIGMTNTVYASIFHLSRIAVTRLPSYHGTLLLTSSFLDLLSQIIDILREGGRFRMNATFDVGGFVEVINDLGLDTLTFLAVAVLVVPASTSSLFVLGQQFFVACIIVKHHIANVVLHCGSYCHFGIWD
ncbi:hypothetical protein L6452_01776 [Arctium lappa]|uniref:Uncharacterized protein n=1 Tax=Arctium lappa TaxID=4217 RepID=A0ACB9FIJ0_ARCLA|nr:hypothetical protein L6452_01776 [Arctium lappa]